MTKTEEQVEDVAAPVAQAEPEDVGPVIHPDRIEYLLSERGDDPNKVLKFDTDEIIIDPSRNISRFKERKITDESVIETAKSIKANGQLQAGRVWLVGNKLYLGFGNGRLLACKRNDMPFYATLAIEDGDKKQALLENAAENIVKLDNNALDKMKMVESLKAAGVSQKDIAARVGLKEGQVSMYARISQLTDVTKTAILEQKITAPAVYEFVTAHTEKGKVDAQAVEADVLALIELNKAQGGKRVGREQAVKAARSKKQEKAQRRGKAAKGKAPRNRQRSTKEIMEFCSAEATPENAKKYGRKVPGALKCIAALASGVKSETVLKNLGAL